MTDWSVRSTPDGLVLMVRHDGLPWHDVATILDPIEMPSLVETLRQGSRRSPDVEPF